MRCDLSCPELPKPVAIGDTGAEPVHALECVTLPIDPAGNGGRVCIKDPGGFLKNGSMITQAKLLTTGQMARHVRVPVAWLREEAEADRVPHLKAGRVFLFEPGAVEAALVERARGNRREVVSA